MTARSEVIPAKRAKEARAGIVPSVAEQMI